MQTSYTRLHTIHIQNCKYFTNIELQEHLAKEFFRENVESILRTMNTLVRYIVIIKHSFIWQRICAAKSHHMRCSTGAKTTI